MDRSSYLSERIYHGENVPHSDRPRADYWRRLLGDTTFSRIQKNKKDFQAYLEEQPYDTKDRKKKGTFRVYLAEKRKQQERISLKEYGIQRLKEYLKGYGQFFTETIYEDYAAHLSGVLQDIYIRTFIAVIHEYKDKGLLEGADTKEEYDFFCREVAGNPQKAQELLDCYPVLARCIEDKTEYIAAYYSEVVRHFAEDCEAVQRELCGGKSPGRITRMTGAIADSHKNGRQVLKVRFACGMELLHKPHSMENERKYGEFLGWLSEKTGIDQYVCSFVSHEEYSWCSIVTYQACASQEQLKNYYKRLGVQLFLTFLLGTKDLHNENVIACGEYPVLIDLETLVNITYNRKRKTVNEEIYYRLSQSVLYTGLLPFYCWNKEGTGINSSAISGGSGQQYPFKVPVVRDGGTSEMRIAYAYPKSKEAENLATLKGRFFSPGQYKEELTAGFTAACRAVTAEKEEFYRLMKGLENTRSRYLVADTQRYAMLLSSSYHPSLLEDGGAREIFLYDVWRGREEDDHALIECEVEELLEGDIPYFYYDLKEKDLHSAKGHVIKDYFSQPAMDILYERLMQLEESETERQCEYIRLALELMPDSADDCMNRVHKVGYTEKADREEQQKNIRYLTDRLMKYAVWNAAHTEVSWFTVQMSSYGKHTWNLMPMNLYLYGGLAGMLLLFQTLCRKDGREESREIARTLEGMLFRYTREALESPRKVKSGKTGMYEGEGSLIYTYLLLYRESGEDKYLDYAVRHARVVEKLLDTDRSYDLLSGNAGAAMVFLYLYEATEDPACLELARRAVCILKKHAAVQADGIGWVTEKGFLPFGGMAHGNSGILMPVMRLWKLTGKREYEELAEQIWRYEETLYDPVLNNWRDVRLHRYEKEEAGAVAWCHGAAGILLSRLSCYRDAVTQEWKERMKRDIVRAGKKTADYWKRDSMCLCHGTCGNLWILERASEITGKACGKQYAAGKLHLLPQEKLNPGFMDGYGGILYYMLKFFMDS